MEKARSNFVNMFLSLMIVCVVSGFALAKVYNATQDPIQKSREIQQQEAIEKVLPEYDDLKIEKKALKSEEKPNAFKKETGTDSITLYHAYKNGTEIGTAVKTFTNKGFGGIIKMMVGFVENGRINKVQILNHSETPGLGSKMTEADFYTQFEGKNPENFELKVKKDGGDVQAITAATISSRAYCDALKNAYSTVKK